MVQVALTEERCYIWGSNCCHDAFSKIRPGLGTMGGRAVCRRALEGESGSAALTAPCADAHCPSSVLPSLPVCCRPGATAVVWASVPQPMLAVPALRPGHLLYPLPGVPSPCSSAQSRFLF